MPDELSLFWCRIERLLGPVAVEFLLYFMASVVFAGVKGRKSSRNCCCWCRLRSILLSSGSWVCRMTEVNCLVKYLSIADGLL